jgi:hypothetical protein
MTRVQGDDPQWALVAAVSCVESMEEIGLREAAEILLALEDAGWELTEIAT